MDSQISIDPQENVIYAGEVQLLRWSESSTTGRTVLFQIPEETVEHPFKRFNVRDKSAKTPGKRFMAVLVEIGDDEKPVAQVMPKDKIAALGGSKPYGKQASVLYRTGWMLNPRIMAAAGRRDDLDAWLAARPCTICGRIHEEDMTLLAPRNDSTGYYAIPVCDGCQDPARNVPEEAFHRKCMELLQEWISQSIARQLGYATLGHVPPEKLLEWAVARQLESTVPPTYLLERKAS